MRYEGVGRAVFLGRPDRFTALVEKDGETERVHVCNTGRCRELLVPGCTVFLAPGRGSGRKTKWDLIAVEKRTRTGPKLINMDSGAPNRVALEWLRSSGFFSPGAEIRAEVAHGDSRFDFHVRDGERSVFVEVKGCTLEEDGACLFPDAPTLRGVKHIRGLERRLGEGHEALLLFIIQMDGARSLAPNDATHPAFGEALRSAAAAGVRVIAVDCAVSPDSLAPGREVKVVL